ncbi:MAG: hypothetical protein IKL82_03760 [Clostridia bacterium]|nr:hypothetical protein [Clostridia bacterium]
MNEHGFDVSSAETVNEKCLNCGSNLLFDPETQKLKCPHCETLVDFEKSSNVLENDIREFLNGNQTWNTESVVYRCENCGASLVLAPNQTAASCPYCGASHVVKSEEEAGLKPGAVYPFTITSEVASNFAKTWAKKRLFAPSRFKKDLVTDKFKGVYQPSYTFDSNTYSTYYGRVGVRHTRTVGSGKNRRTETYIVWRNISGDYSHFFDDVTVNSDDIEFQSTINKLLPFNYNSIKVYDTEYLTGYMAKRSNRTVKDCWGDAKSMMDASLRSLILSRHRHDVVDFLNVSTSHQNVTFKYVLLPVYVSNFKYKKKDYKVFVNGNTGKVTGKTPVSPWRVLIAVILGLAIVALLGYLFYSNS